MPKYRKKPVTIEAMQWTVDNKDELIKFTNGDFYQKEVDKGTSFATVNTLEGEHIATENDFIIKGIKGEHYPCKPDIFEITYEALSEAKKETEKGEVSRCLSYS